MSNIIERKYQMIYYLGEETCAGIYTEDEIAKLLTNSQVTESFRFIGNDTDVWEDDEFRKRVCDKTLALIEEYRNG